MSIAVTGYKGRLGSWLVEQCECVPLDCDISSRESVKKALAEIEGVTALVNCAAWTGVDSAEKEKNRDDVIATNLRGVANLRREFDGLFVQISSGFVLDGKSGPHKEDAVSEPVNFYGWSKLGGELAADIRYPTIVIRVLDLFGPTVDGKSDFVRQIRDLLELEKEKKLPDNLYGTPTYIPHLAEALLEITDRGQTGLVHITGDLTLSRFEWGRMIAEHFDYDPALIVPTSEILGEAPRPMRGGLSVELAKKWKLPIYSPNDGLAALEEWEQAVGESPD